MKKFFIILVILLLFLGIDSLIEPNLLITKNNTLYLDNYSSKLNGLKIGVVSDLHIGTRYVDLKKLNQIVEKLNAEKPDIIVILGDFDGKSISRSKLREKDISSVLIKMQAKHGCYAVLGNHDYKVKKPVLNVLKSTNIKLLVDKKADIVFNNQILHIVGIQDLWFGGKDIDFINNNSKENTIFLSHNPDIFPELNDKISLVLSGHTHGGEIRLPFWGGIYVPSKFYNKYAKGVIKEGHKTLFVSSGVGSLSRLRTFNPPEIVFLTLMDR